MICVGSRKETPATTGLLYGVGTCVPVGVACRMQVMQALREAGVPRGLCCLRCAVSVCIQIMETWEL